MSKVTGKMPLDFLLSLGTEGTSRQDACWERGAMSIKPMSHPIPSGLGVPLEFMVAAFLSQR